MTLEQEFKKKVGVDAYENNQMQPKVYNETYVEWLEAKINYTRCSLKLNSDLKIGDDVLFVGKYTGTIIEDRVVKLTDGTLIGSLDTQRHKFIKII
jgi:hypothetical protein